MGDLVRLPVPEPAPAPPGERTRGRRVPEPLWREAVGERLRRERLRQERRLVDVAEVAGVSTQYLSEVERGRKEPSSEILAAVAGALGWGLLDLTTEVARSLHGRSLAGPRGPVCLAS